jgi:hypothetical protein
MILRQARQKVPVWADPFKKRSINRLNKNGYC